MAGRDESGRVAGAFAERRTEGDEDLSRREDLGARKVWRRCERCSCGCLDSVKSGLNRHGCELESHDFDSFFTDFI